ncbi:MAG: TauD/TfdA family dioxygenase [Acidimicrobiia bacterium]|nr:TauD/TfdA family dioxygenase [Acidimicrobiia bacterium]
MIEIEPLGPIFGARVLGCDLADLDDDTFAAIRAALVEHEVLVFDRQAITSADQIDFGRRFGQLSVSTFSPSAHEMPELIVLDNGGDAPRPLTDIWHSDETFRAVPPMATILRARIVPRFGGDTMFASMTAAYDGLSERMKTYLEGLTATHGLGRFGQRLSEDPERFDVLLMAQRKHPPAHHPVVRIHPESGRRAIFVNAHFTVRIDGLADDESEAILGFLLRQSLVPDYQLRVSWEPDQVTMWDNRSVQHYAPNDYLPQRRRMERVTICGDEPIGAAAPDRPLFAAGGVEPRRTGPSRGDEGADLHVSRATD